MTGLLVEPADKCCKRAEDHLLGLQEVYLHFVWGDPGPQLLSLRVSMSYSAWFPALHNVRKVPQQN